MGKAYASGCASVAYALATPDTLPLAFVPRMFHECSTNVPRSRVRSLLVLTGADGGGGGAVGGRRIAGVPLPLAKGNFGRPLYPKKAQ